MQKWRTTKSKYLVTDHWIRLRSDTCVAPDGHVFDNWYVLEYPDWVNCVVLSKDLQTITMLRHYRHGIDDFVLEIPGGAIDKGEQPQRAITRELNEELGLVGSEIHPIGSVYPNPNMQTNKTYSFIAIGGTREQHKLEPGDTFESINMPLNELLAKIASQAAIMQAQHLSAVLFALNFLQKPSASRRRQ